jgi:hypothetical protein
MLGLGLARFVRGASLAAACKPSHTAILVRASRMSSRRPQATKEEQAALQAEYFATALPRLQQSITPEIEQRLQLVADSVPGLSSSSRVLDAGCGDGILIPHLQVPSTQGPSPALSSFSRSIRALHTSFLGGRLFKMCSCFSRSGACRMS